MSEATGSGRLRVVRLAAVLGVVVGLVVTVVLVWQSGDEPIVGAKLVEPPGKYMTSWDHVYRASPARLVVSFTGGRPLDQSSSDDLCAHDYRAEVAEDIKTVVVTVKILTRNLFNQEVMCTLEGYFRCVEVELALPLRSRTIEYGNKHEYYQSEELPADATCTKGGSLIWQCPHGEVECPPPF